VVMTRVVMKQFWRKKKRGEPNLEEEKLRKKTQEKKQVKVLYPKGKNDQFWVRQGVQSELFCPLLSDRMVWGIARSHPAVAGS